MEALKQIRRKEEALKEVVKEIRGVNEVVDKYGENPSALIQILLDLQAKNHWISKIALLWISERLRIPLSQIYQVVTFYKAFSLKPRGKHLIRVCLGTACHVRGGPKIMEAVERHLGISRGETTPDGLFTLESVNCLGCCALGPVMMVDDKYYGNLTPTSAVKVLDKIRRGESEK
ncbi:NADH-quinone oxidoreductase subunit NuoE [Candidatus Bathyarchaeota archaeon]|nr:MAG: NADH-quinone oxidoreductase subunit NuoE [Candidatus Bathyarchaeota archaeon]